MKKSNTQLVAWAVSAWLQQHCNEYMLDTRVVLTFSRIKRIQMVVRSCVYQRNRLSAGDFQLRILSRCDANFRCMRSGCLVCPSAQAKQLSRKSKCVSIQQTSELAPELDGHFRSQTAPNELKFGTEMMDYVSCHRRIGNIRSEHHTHTHTNCIDKMFD